MASLITISEYRDYDDLPSPAENDGQINSAIRSATAYIEELTGRVFEIADDPSPIEAIETLNGNGTSRIYTYQAPITVLTKLEYWDGTAWQEYDIVTYPYSFKSDSNIAYFTQGHKFYQGWQNIRVTFEYGFAVDFPDKLKWACYLITKYMVAEAEIQNVKSQSDGEQSFSYDHKMPQEAVNTILRYKTRW